MPTELSPRTSLPHSPSGGRRTRRTSPLSGLRAQDRELRQVVLRVRTWGLARGCTCSTDSLTVVAGLALDGARGGRISPRTWTSARVEALLRGDALVWCIAQGVDPPADVGEALMLWFDFLDAHQAFGEGSDQMVALRAAVTAKRRGRARPARSASRSRHPAGRDLA